MTSKGEGWSSTALGESLIDWKKPGLLQLLGLVTGQGPAQENCDLGLKEEVDSGGPHSWRLAANHSPHSRASSFLFKVDAHAVSLCLSQPVKRKGYISTSLSRLKSIPKDYRIKCEIQNKKRNNFFPRVV